MLQNEQIINVNWMNCYRKSYSLWKTPTGFLLLSKGYEWDFDGASVEHHADSFLENRKVYSV